MLVYDFQTATAKFLTIDEGLCVQIMHLGAYDDEPATIMALDHAIRCGNSNSASVYDERGILFI